MMEKDEGVLTVKDMSGESMEQLLKHIYTGATDSLKYEVIVELLNSAVKV
jgi:hypothetical protein